VVLVCDDDCIEIWKYFEGDDWLTCGEGPDAGGDTTAVDREDGNVFL
jgi:hypothetical protein